MIDSGSSCDCDNANNNTSWVFIANEGNFSDPNDDGTVSMIDEFGNVYESDVLGKVVNSLEVYNNKAQCGTCHTLKAAESIYDSANAALSELSGVNLDDEAAQLIQYQQAYQASARVLQTARELFDSLIDRI